LRQWDALLGILLEMIAGQESSDDAEKMAEKEAQQ
jgi:hypothetical protein